MAECQNCGAVVTEQYVRVFAPTGMDTVRVCSNCPDMVREVVTCVRRSRLGSTDWPPLLASAVPDARI